MHSSFLQTLVLVFVCSGLIVYALQLLRVPSIIGLFLAGIALGPSGVGLTDAGGEVSLLAEIGVVLLLFTIGLEVSVAHLKQLWRTFIFAGGIQVLACIVFCMTLFGVFGRSLQEGIFIGFLVACSSTALVLKLLESEGQSETPVGRSVLAILLFQDLCIIPMVLLAPILAGKAVGVLALVSALAKAALVIASVLFLAHYLVPPILYRVLKTKNRELFLTTLVALCLGTAWWTSLAGLSLALGAFLAGLAISESEYSHQVLAEAQPFRDVFSGLFFISLGMLLDVQYLLAHFPLVAGLSAALLIFKALFTALGTFSTGQSLKVSAHAGLLLFQIGEFSFVLSGIGISLGLLNAEQYQLFLSVAVLSMILTLFVFRLAPKLIRNLSDFGLEKTATGELTFKEGDLRRLENHVIVVGYGVAGQLIVKSLRRLQVPYVIMELNPVTVRRLRHEGMPVLFGDCGHPAVLEQANIHAARLLIIAISDRLSTRQGLINVRRLRAGLPIIVRARFHSERQELLNLGANAVLCEDEQTALGLLEELLRGYGVSEQISEEELTATRTAMQAYRP